MERFLLSSVKNFRYERKFYIDELTKDEARLILRCHPAAFREIYFERRVNNIYFDSLDFTNYFDNISGISRRIKVRIRWYGQIFGLIENPALELKLKHNLHIGKITHQLEPFRLDNALSLGMIREILRKSSIHSAILSYLLRLNFSLLNTYRREYFLSADKKYRITLDSEMQSYRLFSFKNDFLFKMPASSSLILEIKYNKPDDELVDRITNYFPFRLTRMSKYATGVSSLYQ